MKKFKANRKEEDWSDEDFERYKRKSMDVLELISFDQGKNETFIKNEVLVEMELERLEFGNQDKYAGVVYAPYMPLMISKTI